MNEPIIDPLVKSLMSPDDGPAAEIPLQLVGTGGELNQTNSAATTSTNVKRAMRRRVVLGNADVSEIRFWWAGWTVGSETGEANIPTDIAMRQHMEVNGVSVIVNLNVQVPFRFVFRHKLLKLRFSQLLFRFIRHISFLLTPAAEHE